jgi:ribosomal protein S18 acetylase RimI-like enzyme
MDKMKAQNTIPAFLIRIATMKDIDCLTELHCDSFRPEDHIPVILGKDYVRATYRWLMKSSEAYCLVADSGHEIMGMVAVCDGSFTKPMFLACLPQFMQSLLSAPRLIFEKRLWGRLLRDAEPSQEAKRIFDHPGFAQFTVVAVDIMWRGSGIFPALIEAAETFSRNRGSVAIRAGVYKFNQRSKRAFAKSGWIETPELETNDTVVYVYYLDPELPNRLGITLPCSS